MNMTDEQIDKLLSVAIPGGSQARDWFLPHEDIRGLNNVRHVVRLMFEASNEGRFIAFYNQHKRIKDLELACTNSTKENEELRVRINQFDDHITTVANHLGAVCGGADVETNIPGSTAFEIIKKIKEIENERNSLLLKAAEMLESLDVINKIIYGETIIQGSSQYFKIRQLATANHSFQEYITERIKSDTPQ